MTAEDNDNDKSLELKDVEQREEKIKYPRSIPFIVVNEFCERFNFYGMKTILVLYLTRKLFYDDDDATIIYHTFNMLIYFTCIIGAVIADSWWGRFRTIWILSIVYSIGSILIAIGAIEILNLPAREFTIIGLLVIAIGSGGIKPCVSAFGGEQFKLPEQAKQLALFFSLFYFSVNSGSLISTMVTPILREDVKCFGKDDCFSFAFGVPAVLMIIAVVAFIAGSFLYKINPPQGNMLVRVANCIGNSFKVRRKEKKTNPKPTFLDYAEAKYGKKLVNETKILLNVLILYLPLPVFWALFDQQGSRWTFQATRMDGNIGFMEIKPDQMQVINPFLILAFIPLYEVLFYPLLAKIGVSRPLQKLTIGGTLAGISFIISAIVELTLEPTYAVLPVKGQSQLRIYNGMNCNYAFQNPENPFEMEKLSIFVERNVYLDDNKFSGPYGIKSNSPDCPNYDGNYKFEFEDNAAVSFLLRQDGEKLRIDRFLDDPNKSRSGSPTIRVLANINSNQEITIRQKDGTVRFNKTKSFYDRVDLPSGSYDIYVGDTMIMEEKIDLKLGGVYALVIQESNGKYSRNLITVTDPNSVSMLWLIPQYVVLTLGEVMYSVTGLQFSFTQAPESMKSVLIGAWHFTIGVGNLIVILITSLKFFDSQAYEFFLFGGLMLVDMAGFSWLAYRYRPIPLETLEDEDDGSDDNENEKKDSPLNFKSSSNNN